MLLRLIAGLYRPVRVACGVTVAVTFAGCATTDPAPARMELSLPFTATGTEPGWHLAMTAERLVLETAYGTARTEAATPVPVIRDDDSLRYQVETPDHAVTITIQHRYCSNAMSGMPHPYSVRVTLDADSFEGCGGDPSTLLTGAAWRVDTLDGRSVDSEPPLTLTFAEDGSVSGHGGCNRYRGTYTLTGEGLHLSPLVSTRMSCGASDAQEQRFLGLLQQVRRFRLAGSGSLVLETADDRSLTAQRE